MDAFNGVGGHALLIELLASGYWEAQTLPRRVEQDSCNHLVKSKGFGPTR